jgi:DNA-binding transcriptional regulator LsrR (DeoR family)
MLKKVAERSIVATDQEIREYIPTELCVQIAESMLSGQLTQEAIAKQIGVQPATVGRAMRNPIFCGWVSTTIHRNVRHRIGMVDAALTNRALGGDVRAMELFYKRFGKLVQRAEVIHSQGYDYAKMTDADLEAMAKTDLNS